MTAPKDFTQQVYTTYHFMWRLRELMHRDIYSRWEIVFIFEVLWFFLLNLDERRILVIVCVFFSHEISVVERTHEATDCMA